MFLALLMIDVFVLFSIVFYFFILKKEKSLTELSKKTIFILTGLFLLFSYLNYKIYSDLDNKGYKIISSYEYKIKNKDYITFGKSTSHIPLFNKNNSVEGYLIKTEKGWELQNLEKTIKKKDTTIKIPYFFLYNKDFKQKKLPSVVEDGDYISIRKLIGKYTKKVSIYKIKITEDSISFIPIFIPSNLQEFWKVYSAAEIRIVDFAKFSQIEKILKSNENLSISMQSIYSLWFGIELVYILTFVIFIFFILKFTQGKFLKEYRFIVYPVFPFASLIMFAFFSSFVNFTYLQFYYTYSKTGTIFITVLMSLFMLFYFFVFYIILPSLKWRKPLFVISFVLSSILPLFWLFKSFLFKGSFISQLSFLVESIILFTIVPLSSLFLYIDFRKLVFNKINFSINFKNFLTYFWIMVSAFTVSVVIAIFLGLVKEGRGISVIEMAKILIILIVLFLFLGSSKLAVKKSKLNLVYYILLIILLFISLVIIKDFGNILQYGLTALIVFILVLNIFDKKQILESLKSKKFIFTFLILAVVLSFLFYIFISHEVLNKIRFALWLHPFDYIGYAGVEQILFGLLSVKLASFLPRDLNSVYLLNIPEAHSDYIFVVFSNIFGILGAFLLILSFFLLPLTTYFALKRYNKFYKDKEVPEFILMFNIAIVSYFITYVIVNASAVLQVFPLTDVPLVFITYSRVLLIVFFIVFFYFIWINYHFIKIFGEGND